MFYIIYQTAFIGDIILATSMVKTIKTFEPDSEIIFVTTPAGELILQNNPNINKIIGYDKRNGKGAAILKISAQIKKITGNNDSVYISPHRFARASLLALLVNSQIRAGFKGSALSFCYNRLCKYEFDSHEVQRNYNLLKTVFGDRLQGKPAMPELFPSDKDYAEVKSFVTGNDIVIAPGSVWRTKRWPAERFSELIKLVADRYNVILIGGKEDRELCDSLVSSQKGVKNLAGNLSILQSAALVGLSKAIITNDSAPLHIASAINTPTIAIFGATTTNLGFGPLAGRSTVIENKDLSCRPCGRHGGDKCRQKHFACMLDISAQSVYKALTIILSEK